MVVLSGILGSIVNIPVVNMKAEPTGPFGPMFCHIPEFTSKNWGLPEVTENGRKSPKTAVNN